MNKKILVPLAEGFEEIEAITIIDVLRRAGCEVIVAELTPNPITASRHTRHLADVSLDQVLEEDYDAIVLPGGRPGADSLAVHEALRNRLRHQAKSGHWIAAVCAGPLALEQAGLLKDKKITCHPTAATEIQSTLPSKNRVMVDDRIITAQAAGSAMEFALMIVEKLFGREKVEEINKGLLAR